MKSNGNIHYTVLKLCNKFLQVIHSGLQIRCIFSLSITPISSPNPMVDHLLESSHRDDSNKWSNIGFGEVITQVVSTEVHFTHLI